MRDLHQAYCSCSTMCDDPSGPCQTVRQAMDLPVTKARLRLRNTFCPARGLSLYTMLMRAFFFFFPFSPTLP